ncbi:MAG: hypothetical protein AB7U51_04270 [Arcobacter sp.]|uniref:hypothetical protein n=1 Tax=Arcobacter sp. TaxID=1872629 RepID=UPI003CFFD5B2
MDLTLEIKDLFLLGSTLTTVVGAYFALKYKNEKNKDKAADISDGLKSFKDFVHKELKEIENQLKNFDLHIKELLRKDDAEVRYISRKEHNLIMKNIDDKIELILQALKDKKDA